MFSESDLDVYEKSAYVETFAAPEFYFDTFIIRPIRMLVTFARSPESELQQM
jgi:hypothetical protein